ncbi:MAG: tetratricopeptide repeat protein [Chloroflexi bacterium]|nr:tetratricopeptide repeat protein [Chloroflexota bacterium]
MPNNIPVSSVNQTVNGNENIQVGGSGNLVQRISQFFQLDSEQQRAQRYRYAMLKLVKTRVAEELAQSLYNEVLLDLNMVKQPNAVERSWGLQVRVPNRPDRALPPGTSILQIFDELNGALLILGNPGAGKTTMLLDLARDTITRAEQDVSLPIPVMFNLSSWSSFKQPIAEWLEIELIARYKIPKKIAHLWIEQNELFLLLDGLDEVKVAQREACIKAINDFRNTHGFTQMVVCSRVADYEAITVRLDLHGAVLLQPLTFRQIGEYFERAGSELVTVRYALQHDTQLLELAREPLMLNIMTLAYRSVSAETMVNEQYSSIELRRRRLFDTYIQEMFDRVNRTKNEPYSREQTKRWLAWLAQKMIEHEQSEFLLERMRKSWLSTRNQRRLHTIMSNFFFIVIELILIGIGLAGALVVPTLMLGIGTDANRVVGLGISLGFNLVAILMGILRIRSRWGFTDNLALRFVLCWNNSIPWNYRRFLDYAVQHIFLRKVGSGYRFIHRLLIEHFVSVELEREGTKDAMAFVGRGFTYIQLAKYDQAITELARAIALEPRDNSTYYLLGNVYGDLKRYDDAIAAFQRAIQLNPKDAFPHIGLSHVYRDIQRYDDAITACQRAIQLDPKDAFPHIELGHIYRALQRYDEALAAYQHAIQLDPDFAVAYRSLGLLFRIMNRETDAIPLLEKLLQIDPQDSDAFLALASVHKKLGHIEESEKFAAQARALMKPDDWYNLACLESVCRNVDVAIEHLRRAAQSEKFDRDWAKRDPDFEWIRADARFKEIVEK